uniref:Glucan endo-1,3-beta-D-glucosidase n=1 Tax=Oryza glumipatula TaxID=40148 RepID=A0A0D9ZAA8_9ORYZ
MMMINTQCNRPSACATAPTETTCRRRPGDVVQLYQSNHIDAMRIYLANATILHSLRGTSIAVIVDAPDVRSLASNDATNALSSAAQAWVQANVRPYYPDVNIKYIAVGNERCALRGRPRRPHQGVHCRRNERGRRLAAAFRKRVRRPPPSWVPSSSSWRANGSPLLANVYPYYAYKNDNGVDLNFALFRPSSTTIDDNGHTYTNLFDAMVDSIYSAMEKEGGSDVPVVISETGWPSADGRGASKDNARVYNQNLINHVGKGTPKRPVALETYIFAMFDENQKKGDAIKRNKFTS